MWGNPPKGSASPGGCGRPGPPVLAPRKRGQQAGAKNGCENCDVNDVVSVFTLIRTDTTLDLSQKAEKVCRNARYTQIYKLVKAKIDMWFSKSFREKHPSSCVWLGAGGCASNPR